MRMNQGNKSAYYIVTRSLKFVRISPDGETDLTTCPHDCTLFTSVTTAEAKAKDLKAKFSDFEWFVRATRTHRPNEYVG